jgi:hypothetical protein
MLQLQRDEQQVGHDKEPEQPPGDGRRPAHEGRKGMMPESGSFLKSRESEEKDYQQRNRGEKSRTDECHGHDGESYS